MFNIKFNFCICVIHVVVVDSCEFEPDVIKFVIDLRQVGGFLWVPWFPPPIKLTTMI
jgi:hypothetical protein